MNKLIAIWIVLALCALAFWLAAFATVLHFVQKFW
jgi:hypothetical protein